MAFDKTAFFAAIQPKTEVTTVAGFGDVILKQLKVIETDAMRANLEDSGDSNQFGIDLLVQSMVDDAGNQIFTSDDVSALKNSSNQPIEALIGVALDLNGFKKAVDAKN